MAKKFDYQNMLNKILEEKISKTNSIIDSSFSRLSDYKKFFKLKA